MRKNVFYLSTLCLFTLSLVFAGCNKNEPEQQTPKQTYHVSLQAGMNNAKPASAIKRALGLEGNTLTASWKTGEQVSVRNVTKNADLEGHLAAETTGNPVNISGDLTGTINAGDELELKFLSPNYTNQLGTLAYIEANCDYAVATIHVESVTWGSITFDEGVAEFENQQAIAKFTLMNEAKDANLAASKLEVEVDGSTYTITPTSATSEIFVALPGFTNQTIKLTATVDSKKYTYTSPTTKTFENGKYYVITVGMKSKVYGFSIDATHQIEFAHGNLQYNPSSDTWRIAREQYDFVGFKYAFASNGISNAYVELGTVYENEERCDNLTYEGTQVENTYTGWIDLFGWNTANNPLNISLYARDYASYQTDFVDWGHNPIYDPKAEITYPADTWRTLSLQEYQYLLFERTNASQLVGTASIEGHPKGVVKGILILPDDFDLPDGLNFKGANETHTRNGWKYNYKEWRHMLDVTPEYFNSADYVFNQNRYTLDEWTQLEAAGAVFLPAAGERWVDYEQSPTGAFEYQGAIYTFKQPYVLYVGQKAVYWTSTRMGEDGEIPEQNYLRDAQIVVCAVDNYQLSADASMALHIGQSVRLVRDLQ